MTSSTDDLAVSSPSVNLRNAAKCRRYRARRLQDAFLDQIRKLVRDTISDTIRDTIADTIPQIAQQVAEHLRHHSDTNSDTSSDTAPPLEVSPEGSPSTPSKNPLPNPPIPLSPPTGAHPPTEKPKPTRKKPAHPIDPAWEPDEQDRAYAGGKSYREPWIADQAERFRDYHLKNGSMFCDWHAAWRTWVQNAAKFEQTSGVRANGHADVESQRVLRRAPPELDKFEAGAWDYAELHGQCPTVEGIKRDIAHQIALAAECRAAAAAKYANGASK